MDPLDSSISGDFFDWIWYLHRVGLSINNLQKALKHKPNNQSNPNRSRQKNHLNSISTLQQRSLTKQQKTQKRRMEYKDKLKIAALTIASLAALSSVIFLITSSSKHYRRRRRKQQQQQKQSSSCYLQSHQKPQLSFKRVLLDNSFSQFKHLNLNGRCY